LPRAASGASQAGSGVYEEIVSSPRTTSLFVLLTVLFVSLFAWRIARTGSGLLAITFLGLGALFLFYSLNYRTLVVRVTPEALRLGFGLFSWTVPFDSIDGCRRDDTSLLRIGGAGIHFTRLRGRYRVMLNFLEHPRVVVALKGERRLVKDVVFSTTRPELIGRLLNEAPASEAALRDASANE